MATTATVTIGSDTFTVYSLTASPNADADSFWNVRLGAQRTAWEAATTDDQNRALVMAADWIDRALSFQGTKTVSSQARAWPRDGVTNSCTNSAVTDGTVPDDIFYAQAWLAGAVLADPTIATSTSQGSNIRRAQAGSASVEFFRATIGASSGVDVRLPQVAHDYTRCYTQRSVSLAGPTATGTNVGSFFTGDDYEFNEGLS